MPKTVIDDCTVTTGWAGTNVAISTDTWQDLTTSFLTSQIKFVFSAAGSVSKTYSPVTTKRNIQFSIIANTTETITVPSDYRMKVKFYSGLSTKEYYLPANKLFQTVSFYNGGLANIDKIEFIALQAIQVMVSEIITYEDQYPLDVYQGVKELIENNITSADQFQIGTVTCSAGASEITITNGKYLDKYAVIKIGSEKHSIESVSGLTVKFLKTYSGKTMLGTFTNEPVYLQIPVGFEGRQEEESISSIGISGDFQAIQKEDFENYSYILDSHSTDGYIRSRVQGTTWVHRITIQAESRQMKILEIILGILKKTFNGKTIFYINGRRHEIHSKEIQFLDYPDATEIFNKIIVECETWVTEENQSQEIQKYGNLTLTTTLTRL